MPHQHNSEYAATVGQDKPDKDGSEAYDRYYGKYQEQRPATNNAAPRKQIPAPFKVGGG